MPDQLIADGRLRLDLLSELSKQPEPFAPGELLFWDDPYISQSMLAAHLSAETDAASRRPETIDRIVDWIVRELGLKPGDRVLDLGCGPGLYATRLARRGLAVTGVDYSRRSVEYATRCAQEDGLAIDYVYQNYLTLDYDQQFDAALLIYGDYCVPPPEKRAILLSNVHRALRPGGRFVLDVTTRRLRERAGVRNGWQSLVSGFWRGWPHLVLTQGFDYPDQSLYLDQYTVVEPDGKLSVYRNWFQDYSPESIRAELEAGGFVVGGLWGDLAGSPLDSEAEWIGVVARRVVSPQRDGQE